MSTTTRTLSAEQVLEQGGLSLPEHTGGMTREEAQSVLAAYLIQGMGPVSKQVRAEFDHGADAATERAGASVLQELVNAMLPARNVTEEALLKHPEWALVIGRFGDEDQIRHLAEIDANLYRSARLGGRLGNLLDEAFGLSGQLQAALRRSGKVRAGWIVRHIFSSPYKSCIPDGVPIGPDGNGSVQTSRGPIALSMTPEFRLRYTDPITGRKTGSVPAWLMVKPADRRLRQALTEIQHYLTALRQDLQDLLEGMYLLGETVPGQWLTRIAMDPLLARYFRYVVFRQAETDFMLMPSGFITADGSAYTPKPHYLVSVPHPLSMDEETLAEFRAVPKRSKAKVPQLHEPVYDISVLPDLECGWEASLESEDGKPVLVLHSNLFVPHGIRAAYKAYMIGASYMMYRIPVHAKDPAVNHILYQMDMACTTKRIGRDDMSVLPLLRINDPKRALKKAMKAGATGLTAALLEELNGGTRSSRAVDDLRL